MSDPALDAVEAEVRRRASPARTIFGRAIRRAIDEVLDGPRTGRYDFNQLEKTEKTYVGTKLEIVVRAELGFERGPKRDLEIAGVSVDHKWALNSVWMIPPESRDEIVLCLGGLQHLATFQVGLVRCSAGHVNWPGPGGQRDQKGTLSRAGRTAMRLLVPPAPLPGNFVANLDPAIRTAAMREPTIQRRVTCLFKALPYVPIPRDAIRTIARTEGDPVRRMRQDRHAGDPLAGLLVLSNQTGGRAVLEALGHGPLPKGHWVAVPRRDLDRVPAAVRARLPASARSRFGF